MQGLTISELSKPWNYSANVCFTSNERCSNIRGKKTKTNARQTQEKIKCRFRERNRINLLVAR